MAVPALSGPPAAEPQRITECLSRISVAEEALAQVRQSLSFICDRPEPAGSVTEPIRSEDQPSPKRQRSRHIFDQIIVDTIKEEEEEIKQEIALRKTKGLVEEETPNVDPALLMSHHKVVMQRCCWGWLPYPIINPECEQLLVWILCGLSFVIYLVFAIPVYIAFDANPEGVFLLMDTAINVYFISDIPVTFLTAYRDEAGYLVTEPSKIAKKYMQSWLIPDIIAATPWDQLPLDSAALELTKGIRIVKLTRILRVAKITRLLRVDSISNRIEVLIEKNPMLVFFVGLMRILFILLGITHWAACGWYMVGTLDLSEGESTWVEAHLKERHGMVTRYIYSLYFTLTTMTTVGYGDIVATNVVEVSFALILLFIASVVFAGLMGALSDLISTLNNDKNAISDKKRKLSLYLHWRHVPNDLLHAVRQHLVFLWETKHDFDTYEDVIKDSLPPILKKDLCYHIYGDILRKAPFLSWMRTSEACFKELATMMESRFLSSGDHIFRVGDPKEAISFLLSGTVRLSLNETISGIAVEDEEDTETARFTTLPANEKTSAGLRAKEGKKTAGATFRSKVLQAATKKLAQSDKDAYKAAVFIQRRWRRKLQGRGSTSAMLLEALSSNNENTGENHILRSKDVGAPNYFGEACLWEPYEEWDTHPPPIFKYSARCVERSEVVHISRKMVQEIIEQYSPWLIKRFEFFRKAVVQGLRAHTERDNSDSRHIEAPLLQEAARLEEMEARPPETRLVAESQPSAPYSFCCMSWPAAEQAQQQRFVQEPRDQTVTRPPVVAPLDSQRQSRGRRQAANAQGFSGVATPPVVPPLDSMPQSRGGSRDKLQNIGMVADGSNDLTQPLLECPFAPRTSPASDQRDDTARKTLTSESISL